MFFFSRRCKHRVRHVLTHSFPSLRSAERRTEAGMADYRRQVEGLSLNAVEDPDPIRVLPALATLRCLPGGYAEQGADVPLGDTFRSEEHTSELQSLMRHSYAVFCLEKKALHHTRTCYPRYQTQILL